MINPLEKLITAFKRFPGIGPRQARRFVDYLLTENLMTVQNLARDIASLRTQTAQCESCYRFFFKNNNESPTNECQLCRDSSRDQSSLLVVAKDRDLEIIWQSGHYAGHFFVLGGLVPILDEAPENKIRLRELMQKIEQSKTNLKEIIIALAANVEGDYTYEYLQSALKPYTETGIKLSLLGRGLSTGTELEYSDAETIRNALKNRSS